MGNNNSIFLEPVEVSYNRHVPVKENALLLVVSSACYK